METSGVCARCHHLFSPKPKRILALDGGGVRGAITVAFLKRIELLLDRHAKREVRLADYFDLIGGTSTGAIIAGALALGRRVSEIEEFYKERAHLAFKKTRWHIPALKPKFDHRGLRAEIEKIVGDCTLGDIERLKTGLCIVAKRLDTGSPWILTNSPYAPYWETPPANPATKKREYIGNRYYALSNLVRASTAAPHFFDPELLPIVEGKEPLPRIVAAPFDQPFYVRVFQAALEYCGLRKPVDDIGDYGLFVDGGVSPYNNPCIALLLVATLAPFGLRWKSGPENLSFISIGTGMFRQRVSYNRIRFFIRPQLALNALLSVISDNEMLTLTQMQWMGECKEPWKINSEIKKLTGDGPSNGKLFRLSRFDIRLEQSWLKKHLGRELTQEAVNELREMDNPKNVKTLYELAEQAAEYQIKEDEWKLEPQFASY